MSKTPSNGQRRPGSASSRRGGSERSEQRSAPGNSSGAGERGEKPAPGKVRRCFQVLDEGQKDRFGNPEHGAFASGRKDRDDDDREAYRDRSRGQYSSPRGNRGDHEETWDELGRGFAARGLQRDAHESSALGKKTTGDEMQIYEILTHDHDELKKLLVELDSHSGEDVPTELLDDIREALVPHSRAEEAVFYNPLRTFADASPKVMHSYREHMEAEGMLRMLKLKGKVSRDWKNSARDLKTALEHHIAEEQDQLFTLARQHFSDEEAEQVGRAFQKLKQEKINDGVLKSSFDLVANLMPPKFREFFGTPYQAAS